ncbi:hypothetical protein GALMADRAFT_248943 [Galerina marginata CBS 339.88]|uniref:Uncharacterized protein n=1 Tax=Galerina marginata (strain CBS 339.88) TaxID=685588 RepID=A0A067T7V0_GALM3|nr:hypothetical protein GALMADRAFT_248943 [Galerina marginata CBS 339.88]
MIFFVNFSGGNDVYDQFYALTNLVIVKAHMLAIFLELFSQSISINHNPELAQISLRVRESCTRWSPAKNIVALESLRAFPTPMTLLPLCSLFFFLSAVNRWPMMVFAFRSGAAQISLRIVEFELLDGPPGGSGVGDAVTWLLLSFGIPAWSIPTI